MTQISIQHTDTLCLSSTKDCLLFLSRTQTRSSL